MSTKMVLLERVIRSVLFIVDRQLNMIALITGITGQDGQHLTALLLSKGYVVSGLVRDLESESTKIFSSRFPNVKLYNGDLSDFDTIYRAISQTVPDEIYNFGGVSDVSESYLAPLQTADVTGLGLLRVLDVIRKLDLSQKVRIYQASSSEIYGFASEWPQNEKTPINPISPYGNAKSFAHRSAQQYRQDYKMHIAIGILYNHEGEFRRPQYVTRKITSSVAKIKLGKLDRFALGDIEARRDWGYAGDYVYAIWKMMQMENPSEYIISSGVTHSVKDFLIEALTAADLEPDLDKYVLFDPKYLRLSSDRMLVGDSTKAKNELNWEPKTSFAELVKLMVSNDLRIESEN